MSRRGWRGKLWYRTIRFVCLIAAKVCYCYRSTGGDRIPAEGPVVLLANHQSYLDPVLVAIGTRRELNFFARRTLFVGPFGWLIRSLDAIPVDRDGFSLSGVRETMGRLKAGEAVMLFPEGTRTSDGELAPLKPGFGAMVRRTNAIMLPVAVAGAFDAWPRQRKLPRFRRVRAHFGKPISCEQIAELSDEMLLKEAERRMARTLAVARRLRAR